MATTAARRAVPLYTASGTTYESLTLTSATKGVMMPATRATAPHRPTPVARILVGKTSAVTTSSAAYAPRIDMRRTIAKKKRSSLGSVSQISNSEKTAVRVSSTAAAPTPALGQPRADGQAREKNTCGTCKMRVVPCVFLRPMRLIMAAATKMPGSSAALHAPPSADPPRSACRATPIDTERERKIHTHTRVQVAVCTHAPDHKHFEIVGLGAVAALAARRKVP
jgi:hypothetical protein